MNHARIAISVLLAVVGACFAADGQTNSSTSKGSQAPHVQSVTSPSFNPTNYNKIAIVWHSPAKQPTADSSEQSIDDDFTFALVQKGYDVIGPADTESLLNDQTVANRSGPAEPDAAKIGKLLNVPAVLIISVSGMSSKPYVAPAPQPEKAETSTPVAGVSNPLSLIAVPTNSFRFHGWGINLPEENQSKGTAPKAPPPKPAAPAAAKAGPQFSNSCSMSARLFSVEDDHILWMGKVTASAVSASAQDYSGSINAAADAIAQAIPSRTTEAKE